MTTTLDPAGSRRPSWAPPWRWPWRPATRPMPSPWPRFRQAHRRRRAKPDASFVTAADTAIERAIRERITARFPEHGLVGEEYGEQPSAQRAALDHRPHRRHPQLHARRAHLRHAARRSRSTASWWWAWSAPRRCTAAGSSWQGGGAWAADTGPDGWDRARRDAHPGLRRRTSCRRPSLRVLLRAQPHRLRPGAGLRGPPGRGLARPWPGRLLRLHAGRRGRRRGHARGRPARPGTWPARGPSWSTPVAA